MSNWLSRNPRKSALTGLTAAMLLAVPFIIEKEGESLVAYQDVGGVWTYCHGETRDVTRESKATKEQCYALTQTRVGQFMEQVANKITVDVPPGTLAAHTSFAYNIGIGGYSTSQALKLTNKGKLKEGCNAMMNWYTAGGRDCRIKANRCSGLVARRQAEVKLCKEEL